MNPHRPTLITLLVLVVLAGCLGGTGATPTPDPSATATPTATRTATTPTLTTTVTERPPSTTFCPAFVFVDRVEDVPADATATPYENLSADRREEFDAAVSEGSVTVEEGGEAYQFWWDVRYVRYEETVYRSSVAVC